MVLESLGDKNLEPLLRRMRDDNSKLVGAGHAEILRSIEKSLERIDQTLQ
jgi:hypothetical protein